MSAQAVRDWSVKYEQETGKDSIPTIERVYMRTERGGGIICIFPGCNFVRKDAEAMWRHVHASKKHGLTPAVVAFLNGGSA